MKQKDQMEVVVNEKEKNGTVKVEDSDSLAIEDSIIGSAPTKDLNIEDSQNHRQHAKYSSESSDFETDESSDSEEFLKDLRKNVTSQPAKNPVILKTKGELLPFELPPVEDLHITEDVANLQKIGKVLHIVIDKERNENFVIVESIANSSPLDENSVLFLASGDPLGKVHDIFGIVNKPNYSVRFNKPEDINNKGVVKEQDVFYSPTNDELTNYVLVDDLKQQKGSDASWKDNNEPPADQIDYSDDEQEKIAKQKRRAKNRKKDRNCGSEEEKEDAANNNTERQHERTIQARPPRNNLKRSRPGSSRSSTHSSSGSFGCTPSPPHTRPITCNLERNVPSSRPTTSINRSFLGNNVLQSFEPFPQSNVPNPMSFGSFQQNRGPPQSVGTFSRNIVSPHQFASSPLPSPSFTPPGFPSPFAAAAHQQSSSSLMPSPQSNIPPQQQFLSRPRQATASFFSHPPPNYNPYENSRPTVNQNPSFAPPMFGVLPATVHTLPNISNPSFVNQNPYSFETRNGLHNDLSANSTIYQSNNISPINSNGNQGLSYGMGQSNTANPSIFPPGNTQHIMNTPFSISSNTQSPFLPSQTPPPTNNPFAPSLPAARHPMPPPQSPFLLSQTPPPTNNPFAPSLPPARYPMPPPHYPH